MQYFSEHQGKVYAILNSMQRKTPDAAMITMPLDTREYSLYQEMKTDGLEDSAIFQKLFPTKIDTLRDNTKVKISVGALNKRQVIVLITEALGVSLPTLPRMSTPDLRKLLLGINKKSRA